MKHSAIVQATAVLVVMLCGCSSQQLYNIGQGWQRNECIKIPDQQERSRCLAGNSMSYEQYKRETDAAAGAKPTP